MRFVERGTFLVALIVVGLGSGGLGELQKLACAKKTGQHYIVSIP